MLQSVLQILSVLKGATNIGAKADGDKLSDGESAIVRSPTTARFIWKLSRATFVFISDCRQHKCDILSAERLENGVNADATKFRAHQQSGLLLRQ
jgi:hypothetical protein